MPPRKSDASAKGDISLAQFVYDGDENGAPTDPPQPPTKPIAPSKSAPTTTTDMDVDQPSESVASAAKDKEKEKRESRESGTKDRDTVTIEDLGLPKSIITRLAKGVLPPNTQIQANALMAMCKSATVFISHLADAANEHTQSSNKKTIMPNDVFAALDDIEFPFFRERLEAEFKKFNEIQTTKRNTYRRRVAAQKRVDKATTGGVDPNTSTLSTATNEPESAPKSKKQKPNAPDDSTMDIDGDETAEPRDASDPESEPDQANEQDDDEDEQPAEEEEEEEEDDENEGETQDALEERRVRDDDEDALDNGDESD